MKIQITACDIDQGTPAETYEVTVGGETVSMDLCGDHARPILDLIAQARGGVEDVPTPRVAQSDESPRRSVPARRRPAKKAAKPTDGRRKAQVTSMEDIEAKLRDQKS